jgi:glycosyltransferase involved in cell wall biosynthesis
VVPVFNGAAFLGEALASARAQVGVDLEIIVVDDGSTDGSAALARALPGVRVLAQPRQGAAAAKNRGVEAAGGTLLAFLDADDRWPPGTLAARREQLLATGADIVFGRMQEFREADAPPSADVDTASRRGLVAGTMLMRRADFLRVGPFDERFRFGEFIDWYERARTLGLTTAHFDALALERRIHANNTGRDSRGAQRGYAEVLRAALVRRRQQGGADA